MNGITVSFLEAARALCSSHDDEHGGFTPAPKFPSPMKMDFLLALRESHACSANFRHGRADRRRCAQDPYRHGPRGSLRSSGWWFRSLQRGCRMENSAFRENALRQRPPARHLCSGHASPTRSAICSRSRGNRDMATPRHAVSGRRFLLQPRRPIAKARKASTMRGRPSRSKKSSAKMTARLSAKLTMSRLKATSSKRRPTPYCLPTTSRSAKLSRPFRAKLLETRSERPAPARDEKQVAAWNALLIRGLAEAGIRLWPEGMAHPRPRNGRLGSGTTCATRTETSTPSATQAKTRPDPASSTITPSSPRPSSLSPPSSTGSNPAHPPPIRLRPSSWPRSPSPVFAIPSYPAFSLPPMIKKHPLKPGKSSGTTNALPSGNSSLLRVFASLHQLTGEERWFRKFSEARAAYPNLARRVPQGIGHALAALAEQAIGITVIKIKDAPVEPLVEVIRQKPYRLVHLRITEDAEQPTGYQLCVGTECKETFRGCLGNRSPAIRRGRSVRKLSPFPASSPKGDSASDHLP